MKDTHLFLGNEDRDGRVEPRTEGDGRRTLDLKFVHYTLRPLRRPEHLDLLANQANSVRLGDGVL